MSFTTPIIFSSPFSFSLNTKNINSRSSSNNLVFATADVNRNFTSDHLFRHNLNLSFIKSERLLSSRFAVRSWYSNSWNFDDPEEEYLRQKFIESAQIIQDIKEESFKKCTEHKTTEVVVIDDLGVVCVRMDLPGLSSEQVKVWSDGKNQIIIDGEGGAGGVVVFPDDGMYKIDEFKVEVKDGVLNMMIRKHKKKGSNLHDSVISQPCIVNYKSSGTGCEQRIDKDAIYLRVDMAGLTRDQVEVYVENDKLIMKGTDSRPPFEQAHRTVVCVTCLDPRGQFKIDAMTFDVKNGILTVVLPTGEY